MTLRLKELLDAVKPAKTAIGDAQFIAIAIPTFSNHFVGWNNASEPCLLIKTTDSGFLAPLKLSALEVQFCVPCEIVLPNDRRERYQLTVVTCTSADGDLRNYFLHLMGTVIEIVGAQPTLHGVSDAIGKLVEILQHLSKPASRNVAGLYAELLVIAVSQNPIKCVAAWRANPTDRFDFALDDARLETKATSDRIRSHYFALEQCVPPVGTYAVIASMFVEQSGAGQSLEELLGEVQKRLSGDMQALLKLRTVVANSLGASLPGSLPVRFDSALARSTIVFFKVEDIPAIRPPVPSGVSAIRFRSDLTGVPLAAAEDVAKECASLVHLLPLSTQASGVLGEN
ncbi:MAG TPA: PD-(D/E)XK motif protein [Sphingomicrobium sp.]|nr:PD-(D/E)XK motif protein [Sphingomicrobium sp.]